MSRLRDEYPMLPSHAAIVRQQTARLEETAHLGVAPDFGLMDSGAPGGEEEQGKDCRIIDDQEEALIYI